MKLESQEVSKLCSKCRKNPRHIYKTGNQAEWCKDCIREKDRLWYQKNKEKSKTKTKLWQKRNPKKAKKYRIISNRRVRKLALNHYGGNPPKCACCGEKQEMFLTIDHINNNGREHRKEVGYGSIYVWLKKHNYPKGFQILCYNCNCSKGFYGFCPHRETRDEY